MTNKLMSQTFDPLYSYNLKVTVADYFYSVEQIMETVIPLSKGGTGGTSVATARSKIGANNASNLTTGTLPAARLPFKIQYGQTSVTGVAWTTVTLSGFTNTPTIVVSYAGNPTSSGIAVLKTGSESASSFQVCMAGSSGSGTRKVNWIAIGT